MKKRVNKEGKPSNTADLRADNSAHQIWIVPVDLKLLDPQSELLLEESVLLGIHGGTGLVAGVQMGSRQADAGQLVQCLEQCLLPKAPQLECMRLPGHWPVSGLFDAFKVPASSVGEFEPILRRLLDNYRVRLEVRADDAPIPGLVHSTAEHVARRIEEAYCLDEYEIEHYWRAFPNVVRRATLHAFSYRPGRGFLECIASPPEWEQYCRAHPLKELDEILVSLIGRDCERVTSACQACQVPEAKLMRLV